MWYHNVDGGYVWLIEGNYGLVRDAEVKVDKTGNIILHPINCLNPTEVCAEVNKYEYSQ